jgi:hypothetical protein
LIDIELFSVINNYAQIMPQVRIKNIEIPFAKDDCELDVQGGLIAKIVEKYSEVYMLRDLIQAQQVFLKTVVAK